MLTVVAFACHAAAQTTTMQVPRGSGVFPTIGQVECLEESGSGRYCAATYECGNGSSGELWGDMANHNGRRAIGADSPVANQLDCVVAVDGEATVRWFHGYRPTGRDGELVGLSPVDSPEPPTIRRDVRLTGSNDLWLPWFIHTRNLGDIRSTLRERDCGHIKQGTDQLDDCLDDVAGRITTMGRYSHWQLTPVTMCAAELAESYIDLKYRDDSTFTFDSLDLLWLRNQFDRPNNPQAAIDLIATSEDEITGVYSYRFRNFPSDTMEKYRECRELYETALMESGLSDADG